ncbi:hypothetical protein NKJ26_03155 [Mesorhizobium sp. M0152]|uniref:hypothetical protein n=1 Tax=Mesorhizobium sp. M0152 TaxID=2956898 RepID=UPI0033357F87
MTRLQIPAYTDRWMMGDRYGSLDKVTKRKSDGEEIAHVTLEKSGNTVRVILADCT